MKMSMCCGEPLVGTLLFSKKEFFCTVCHRAYGMFGAPSSADATPDLIARHKKIDAAFRAISKNCLPSGCYLQDCHKCNAGEPHEIHASDEEIEKSEAAYRALNEMRPPEPCEVNG